MSLEARIPPPIVAVFVAFLMWVVARLTPSWTVAIPARNAIAATITVAGVAVVAAGILQFRRARTTVNPLAPAAASALVDSGVFRLTRNPMYLGFAVVLLAWAVFLASPLSTIGVIAFVAYMNRFQIAPEERALRGNFPGAFDAYARRVRRWI